MTKIILGQGFCPSKIKITQYPDAWIPSQSPPVTVFNIYFHIEMNASYIKD